MLEGFMYVTCTVCSQAESLNHGKLATIPIQLHAPLVEGTHEATSTVSQSLNK